MNLPTILDKEPGEYIWLFKRHTTAKSISEAQTRVTSALQRERFKDKTVKLRGILVVDAKNYETEPALVINIE